MKKIKVFTTYAIKTVREYSNSFSCTAAEEEEKVKLIEEDVALKQRLCAEDLEKAEPALVAAQAALDTLNKVNPVFKYEYYNGRRILVIEKVV